MKKTILLLPLLLGVLSLTGCGSAGGVMMTSGLMYGTKPGDKPPADTADQIPPHESWCYATLGEQVECFAEPQNTIAERLVNVDPQSRYPLSNKAYHQTLLESEIATARREQLATATLTTVQTEEMKPLNIKPKKKIMVKKKAKPKKPAPKKKAMPHKKKLKPKKTVQPAQPKAPPEPIPNPPDDHPIPN